MMNNNMHINDSEWVALFSHHALSKEWLLFQSRIMMHIKQCDECRAFYEKSIALRDAARALASACARMDDSAYQAVASAGGRQAKKHADGSLSVCIASQAGNMQFAEETLEQLGMAEKYAMNLESEGKRLIDDGEALQLALQDGRLRVQIWEPDLSCRWQLINEDEQSLNGPLTSDGSVNEIPIPADGFMTLEITFSDKL